MAKTSKQTPPTSPGDKTNSKGEKKEIPAGGSRTFIVGVLLVAALALLVYQVQNDVSPDSINDDGITRVEKRGESTGQSAGEKESEEVSDDEDVEEDDEEWLDDDEDWIDEEEEEEYEEDEYEDEEEDDEDLEGDITKPTRAGTRRTLTPKKYAGWRTSHGVVPENCVYPPMEEEGLQLKIHSDVKKLRIFRNGGNNTEPEGVLTTVILPVSADGMTVAQAIADAAVLLGYVNRDPHATTGPDTFDWTDAASYRVFTLQGEVLNSDEQWPTLTPGKDDDADLTLVLVPRDEHFIWPGLYVGWTTVLTGVQSPNPDTPLVLQTVSLSPRVFRVVGFLAESEADRIIEEATLLVRRSEVYDPKGMMTSEVRTSSQTWFTDKHMDKHGLGNVDPRVEALSTIPGRLDLDESLQVIHYGVEQHYHSHHDYFDAKQYPKRPDLAAGYNRLITVLFYLNDVEEGGSTTFPYSGDSTPVTNYADCERGVQSRAARTDAVMFYSLEPENHMNATLSLDKNSLHGGCDVLKGEKWAANKWISNWKYAHYPYAAED